MEEKNITLSSSCPVNIIGNIDPDRIQQVLLNILDNARKHTPEGKSISLEVTQNDREITITILDEGEGIPKEEYTISI